MSDSLREAHDDILEFLDELAANGEPGKRKAQNPILLGNCGRFYAAKLRAALSAPQADAEAWQLRTKHPQEKTWSGWEECEKLTAEFITKTGSWDGHDAQARPLYTASPSQSAATKKVYILRTIVEIQASYADQIRDWLNAPSQSAETRKALERELADCQSAVEIIEKHRNPANETQNGNYRFYQGCVVSLEFALQALSRADEGKESEGSLNRQARNPAGLPDSSGDLASAGGIAGVDVTDHRRQVGSDAPSDPTPPDQREAIARIVDPEAFAAFTNSFRRQNEARGKADAILALQRGGA